MVYTNSKLLEKWPISGDLGDGQGGSWSHVFSWKSLQCHFKPQIFFGAAAPLPGAAWPPRRGPPQRARFSFFTESYDFAAPFRIRRAESLISYLKHYVSYLSQLLFIRNSPSTYATRPLQDRPRPLREGYEGGSLGRAHSPSGSGPTDPL